MKNPIIDILGSSVAAQKPVETIDQLLAKLAPQMEALRQDGPGGGMPVTPVPPRSYAELQQDPTYQQMLKDAQDYEARIMARKPDVMRAYSLPGAKGANYEKKELAALALQAMQRGDLSAAAEAIRLLDEAEAGGKNLLMQDWNL